MTVSLSYDPVLSRIRITATGLETAELAQVERSTDQIRWRTVRGGADVPVPVGGLFLPQLAGSYASTPDTAALDIVGDIDLRVDATLDDWGADQVLAGKWLVAGQRSYRLETFDDTLTLTWSNDGTTVLFAQSTALLSSVVAPGGRLAVRATLDVDNGAAGKTVRFYTARNIDDGWVPLGNAVTTATTTSIFSSTAVLEVGSANDGTTDLAAGTCHAVEVRNGIGGTIVADPWFFEDAPTGATSFVDGAGRTWTVNGTATIKRREVLVDDYEFAPDRTNYYRVSAKQVISVVRGAAATFADNASVVPTMPEGLRAGDLLLVFGAIRNDGTGTPNTPTDYTSIEQTGGTRVSGKVHDGSEAAPTQAFTGGVAGATTGATMARVRGVDTTVGTLGKVAVASTSTTAQNINTPAIAAPAIDGEPVDGALLLYLGYKQDDWTGAAPPDYPDVRELGDASSALGSDMGLVWGSFTQPTNDNENADTIVVTGGASAFNRGIVLTFAPATIVQAASIYANLDGIWIKSVMRSFLNRTWSVLYPGGDEIGRAGRGAEHEVRNRTLPTAVTELGGSRQLALIVRTTTAEDTRWLDYVIAAGDVIFVHAPADCPVPTLYARIVSSEVRRIRPTGQVWRTTIPIREVAAPGPDIITASATWDTIFAQYGTFDQLLADFATFDELLELVGDPSEVIVE